MRGTLVILILANLAVFLWVSFTPGGLFGQSDAPMVDIGNLHLVGEIDKKLRKR